MNLLRLHRRLVNSRFVAVSALLHTLLVIVLGGTVLIERYVEKGQDFTMTGTTFVEPDNFTPPRPDPPAVHPASQQIIPAPAGRSSVEKAIQMITTSKPDAESWAPPMPPAMPRSGFNDPGRTPAPGPRGTGISPEILRDIGNFTGWRAPGPNSGGSSLASARFKFTACLARYRDGNWNSTVRVRDGKIVAGSLPNLLYYMRHRSKDRIDSHAEARPLDLASDEIFAVRPPFIFFTGHKDFTLTEIEVANLRKYIRLGGCIWGDSSLPGQRSRFDIAFKREMRRVMPDMDKDFEPLPPDHPIFTAGYFKQPREIPTGMNHYQHAALAMKYMGEIAILYTANDYGDLWQIGLDKDEQIDTRRDEHGRYVAINDAIYKRRSTLFRNIDQPALAASYRFGTNVVIHLLTRWEDRLRNMPRGL